jgi:hypothetical protein
MCLCRLGISSFFFLAYNTNATVVVFLQRGGHGVGRCSAQLLPACGRGDMGHAAVKRVWALHTMSARHCRHQSLQLGLDLHLPVPHPLPFLRHCRGQIPAEIVMATLRCHSPGCLLCCGASCPNDLGHLFCERRQHHIAAPF